MAFHSEKTIASLAAAFRDDYSKEELAAFLAEYALNDVMTDRTQGTWGNAPPACRALAERELDKTPETAALAPVADPAIEDAYTADGIFEEWAARPEVAARLRTVSERIIEGVTKDIKRSVEQELGELREKFSKSREHAADYQEIPQEYARALMKKLDRCAAVLREKALACKAPDASDNTFKDLFACHATFIAELGCNRSGVQFISPDDEYQAFCDMLFKIGYLTARCMTFTEFKEQMAKDRPVTSENMAAIRENMHFKLSMYEPPRKRKK
jgi:hypothetical protein